MLVEAEVELLLQGYLNNNESILIIAGGGGGSGSYYRGYDAVVETYNSETGAAGYGGLQAVAG